MQRKDKIKVFFGIFAFVILMIVFVSAIGENMWSINQGFDEQGVLTGWEELLAKDDLGDAGYGLDDRRYSFEDFLEIIRVMRENDNAYDADWQYIDREMKCFYEWFLTREPGEIFQFQENDIISYCLPSGVAPWEIFPDPDNDVCVMVDSSFCQNMNSQEEDGKLNLGFGEGGIELGDNPGGNDDDWETNNDGTNCTAVKKKWLSVTKKYDQCAKTCKDNQEQCNQCCVHHFNANSQSWDRNKCIESCTEAWDNGN